MTLGGLVPSRDILVYAGAAHLPPSRSVAGCRPAETLRLACLTPMARSGRMIAALCKLPHPRSRGQVSSMAQIQSSLGEACAVIPPCQCLNTSQHCPGTCLWLALLRGDKGAPKSPH